MQLPSCATCTCVLLHYNSVLLPQHGLIEALRSVSINTHRFIAVMLLILYLQPCGGAIPLCMVQEFDLPQEIIDRKVWPFAFPRVFSCSKTLFHILVLPRGCCVRLCMPCWRVGHMHRAAAGPCARLVCHNLPPLPYQTCHNIYRHIACYYLLAS